MRGSTWAGLSKVLLSQLVVRAFTAWHSLDACQHACRYTLSVQPCLPAFLSCFGSGRLLTWMSCFRDVKSLNINNVSAEFWMLAISCLLTCT